VNTKDAKFSAPSRKRREEIKSSDDQVYAKVDPKVMVPFASAPGRLPRSVVVEKTKKLYQAFNLQAILDEVGIEWQNPKAALGAWMPLELFDNSDFEDRLPEDWLEIIKESNNKPLRGRMLCSDPDNEEQYIWREVKVTGYDPTKKLYKVTYDNTTSTVHKLKLFIESEDPRIFANRFVSAYYRRAYADSLIRYNFYIENMPTDEIPGLSNEQIDKMINQATAIRSFNGREILNGQNLITEINSDFTRTMNKISEVRHEVYKE
jgi:dynein heavy chain